MKIVLKTLLMAVLLLVVGAGGVFGWAKVKDRSLLSRHIAVHDVDFPIPFPLTPDEVAETRREHASTASDGATTEALTPDRLDSIALERARARGRHLVESRYGCVECHGSDFGGGTMVDAAPIGRILGPNLTTGKGSRTLSYTAKDWDHIVRHGIKPDGTPAAMPSADFRNMSDEELSDIVAYIRSRPPVDSAVPPPTLGPVGSILLATGKLPLSADLIKDHERAHPRMPPAQGATVEFGAHLANVCSGCHGQDFSGGPIPGGDPSWAAAANLTPAPDGLGDWTYEQFVTALTQGRRPDGTDLRSPMKEMAAYGRRMTDVERQAIWMYLQSLPAVPTGK